MAVSLGRARSAELSDLVTTVTGQTDSTEPLADDIVASRTWSRTGRQVVTFAAIGVVSTLAYIVLYGALRSELSAQPANLLALGITALGNTTANRWLTFEVRVRDGFVADQLAGLGAFAVALAITTVAIGLLDLLAPDAGLRTEIAVVVVANGLATLVRFVVLRSWLDRAHRARSGSPAAAKGVHR